MTLKTEYTVMEQDSFVPLHVTTNDVIIHEATTFLKTLTGPTPEETGTDDETHLDCVKLSTYSIMTLMKNIFQLECRRT